MQYPEWITRESERRMAEDFRLFLWLMWRALRLPEPTPAQYDMAHYLQHGPRRRVIEAFRGVGKSWITAVFVLWCLWRNPQERIMVVSANEDRAVAFATFCIQLIETIDVLAPLRPKAGSRQSVKAFDVGPAEPDQAPSLRCVGILGQMTGGRATKIVADDVEVPKNSLTETMRERLGEAIREFDAILKPGGQVIYLGTPQTEQSIYNKLPDRGYDIRIWPARYPKQPEESIKKGESYALWLDTKYRGHLAPMIREVAEERQGRPTDPDRFDELDLQERESSYGRSGFALQFMLDTSLSDAERYPLRLRDLIVMDLDRDKAPVGLTWASGTQNVIEGLPVVGLDGDRYHSPMYVSTDHAEYEGAVMHIDPSGRGQDETAYCVTKQLNSHIFVRRWGGLSGGYDESTLRTLAEIAKEEGVNEVHIEENWGDGMFRALFEPVLNRVYPCTIVDYRVSGMKEQRIIDKLEPALNQHRVVMDKALIEADYDVLDKKTDVEVAKRLHYSGFYQMTHLTREKGSLRHDDRIDVLAESIFYWMQHLKLDPKSAEERYREKLLAEQLERHQEACKAMAGRRRGRTYVNGPHWR